MSGVLVFSLVILMTGASLVGSRGVPVQSVSTYIGADGVEREIHVHVPETEVKQVVNVLEIEGGQGDTLYGQSAHSRMTRQAMSGRADDMIGKWQPHFGELEDNMLPLKGMGPMTDTAALRERRIQVGDMRAPKQMGALGGLNAKEEVEYYLKEGTEGQAGQWQPGFGELEDNMLSHKGEEAKSVEAEGPHQK